MAVIVPFNRQTDDVCSFKNWAQQISWFMPCCTSGISGKEWRGEGRGGGRSGIYQDAICVPADSISSGRHSHWPRCCGRKRSFLNPRPPYFPPLLSGSPCLACLSLGDGKKKKRKVISLSHYRWPFHWPGVIAIMRCGSRERLWWGVRANTRASANILSTLYLDTARLFFAWLVAARSEAFLSERFSAETRDEMTLDTFSAQNNLAVQYVLE